jgi:glycosyltransferase involved in cell wall biosynthesis
VKIAFDVSQTGPSKAGCGFYAAALIDGLLAAEPQRHSFTLLTGFGDFFHDPLMAAAFPHRSKGVSYGPRLVSRRQASDFWQNREQVCGLLDRFDLLHANNFWCPPWQVSPGIIYTLYDMSFADHPEWTTEVNRIGCFHGVLQAALNATWFVAISQASRQSFLRHFPHVDPRQVRVIYPASRFEQPGFQVKPTAPDAAVCRRGNPFLLSVGTIEPRKNQHFLLDAYNQFRASGGAPLPLVMAGGKGWLMEHFESHRQLSPWSSDIHLLGYVSEAELAWLYSNCLVNLYPSHYEGFGLPVLEGMGMGAPVLCSDRTSLPEIVADAGLLLPPDDVGAWVQALHMISSQPEQRERLSRAAVARSKSFSWQRSTDELLDLYGEAGAYC